MIQLWVADLADAHFDTPDVLELLSRTEKVRADHMAEPSVRARWQASRAALRLALGENLRAEAGRLEISQSRGGAPSLPDFPCVRFSNSHSANLALVAVGVAFGSA